MFQGHCCAAVLAAVQRLRGHILSAHIFNAYIFSPGSRHYNLENGRLIDLGDARQVWFNVRDVNDDEKLDTILYKTKDRSKIFGVLDDYDGRGPSHIDYALNADFFVDNTITVTGLDII
jgi:hypothetical protein